MAKKPKSVKLEIQIHDVYKFLGYMDAGLDSASNMSPLLLKDDYVRVINIGETEDGTKVYEVRKVSPYLNGSELGFVDYLDEDDSLREEQLYEKEMSSFNQEELVQSLQSSEASDVTEEDDTEDDDLDIGPIVEANATVTLRPVNETELVTTDIDHYLASQNPHAQLTTLINRVEECYYDIGGLLCYINDMNVHHRVSPNYTGPKGFASYCINELNYSYRKAAYLMAIYRYFSSMGFKKSDLARIGWSKAKELVDVTSDRDELTNLMRRAEDVPVAGIKRMVDQYKKETQSVTIADAVTEERVRYSFVASPDKARMFEQAFSLGESVYQTENRSSILEYILFEWLQTQGEDVSSYLTPESQAQAQED